MSPLFIGNESIAMRNDSTGQEIVCRASIAPPDAALEASHICEMSCEEYGFHAIDGTSWAIDFFDRGGFRRAQQRWIKFIPPSCRPPVS
jgi:hypothetical protein